MIDALARHPILTKTFYLLTDSIHLKLSYAAIVHIQILVHVTEQKQLPQHYK